MTISKLRATEIRTIWSSVEDGAGKPPEPTDVVQKERRKDQCREDCVKEEYRKDGVTLEGCLLGGVIESEKGCGYECEYQPHCRKMKIIPLSNGLKGILLFGIKTELCFRVVFFTRSKYCGRESILVR